MQFVIRKEVEDWEQKYVNAKETLNQYYTYDIHDYEDRIIIDNLKLKKNCFVFQEEIRR